MDKSSVANETEQACVSSKDVIASGRINMQMMQNIRLIWLDNKIDENSAECRNTLVHLRSIIHIIDIFTDPDQCIDFLTDIHHENLCIIISDGLCQYLLPLIHDIRQLQIIFVFCKIKTPLEQWAKDWAKVKSVFTEISSISEPLKQAMRECERNAISMSFASTADDIPEKKLDQLPTSFMYTQILKEILLSIPFERRHFLEFIDYCREMLADNKIQLKTVDQFLREYRDEMSIWWYTYECFLYSMLNRALRLMDVDMIIKIGFFICDLHRHIEHLHQQQFSSQQSHKSFTVYRGQGMLITDFEQMSKNKGGLISFNSFLSTSKDLKHSLFRAESNQGSPDLVGILFIMAIDSSISSASFASIGGISQFVEEDEILFSMHAIFRIGDITPVADNNRIFQVKLVLTSDNDKDLRRLTDHIREETFPRNEGWYRLGFVLQKMGQPKKAQRVYEILLEQETGEGKKSLIYHQLGCVKEEQEEYQEAIVFYKKVLEIDEKRLSPNHADFARLYNNMGNVYSNMGDYPQALSFYERAIVIQQQSRPPNYRDLASFYNNISNSYFKMGDYPKALSYNEEALAIQQQSLPPNHPHLAVSYSIIGIVHRHMDDYPKSLSSYEKALAIQQQSLPPNHPNLAISYQSIGALFYSMDDHSKALLYHEKALTIKQQLLPPNHPNLAISCSAIGIIYRHMGYYLKSLSSFEKALAIQQQSLPPNHSDLANSYSNIGALYHYIGDHSKALLSHEKALAIQQQSLPPNHPHLANYYIIIGFMYRHMDDYPKSLSSYEKALAIQQQSLPSNHPDLACSYNLIGIAYQNMGDCPKALPYYEKALAIKEQSLPPNHPDLARYHYDIGILYEQMGNYSRACSSYQHAVKIGANSPPANHSHLREFQKRLENLKKLL